MSVDITPTLKLLRQVLTLEIRQGYKNRSTSGAGVQAFFRQRFDAMEHDEASVTTAQSVLAYLHRYEVAATIEERRQIVATMLRRLDATESRHNDAAPPTVRNARAVEDSRADGARRLPGTPDEQSRAPRDDHAGAGRSTPGEPAETASPRESDPRDRPITGAKSTIREALPPIIEPAPSEEQEWQPAPNVALPTATSLDEATATALDIRTQEQPRLETLGVGTLRAAIEYWPRDHYDFSAPVRINRMQPEMQTTLVGTLRSVELRRLPNRNVQIVEAKIADHTGVMAVNWFNQPYLARQLKPRVGEQIAVSGKVEMYNGRLQLAPRDVEFPADDEDGTDTRRIVPVYPAAEGISQRWIRKLIRRALAAGAGLIQDPLPDEARRRFNLPERRVAVERYHFPESIEARDRARNRLALDELLLIQLGMLQRKRQWQGENQGRPIAIDPEVLDTFRASLPFTLTGAQDRALSTILEDMGRPVPMSRLLQGDVGSGKTVVAAAALLACARAGMQGAIMAPTEILAEQHARTLRRMLEPHGVSVALLTGSITRAQRARLYLEAVEGKIQVLAGTHALIQEGFTFKQLGLAIVDEQHRFGVVQRAALKGKGYNPHLLVMTATPIPRTLTLTMYGDLDVCVIDERPPNRQPVETTWVTLEKQAYTRVSEQVAEGRQAYVICPLVEESEALEAKAAVAEHRRLQDEVFTSLRLGLLHGKMRPQDKDAVLGRFRDGEIDVLVATSVVEVGIDVPNATVMVVQDAQRFGLAQLHQFRGRVGRGAAQSYCMLLADAHNPVARERLSAMCETDDGFRLAEEDLRLRGPGEFWGTRQSGLPALQVAQVTDTPTLELARQLADTILEGDPGLEQPHHALLAETVRRFWDTAAEPS